MKAAICILALLIAARAVAADDFPRDALHQTLSAYEQLRSPMTAAEYRDNFRDPLRLVAHRWSVNGRAKQYPSCASATDIALRIGAGLQRDADPDWLADQRRQFHARIDECRRAVNR